MLDQSILSFLHLASTYYLAPLHQLERTEGMAAYFVEKTKGLHQEKLMLRKAMLFLQI